MKFASVLRNSAEELPDLADLFALYKQLKKSLKRIPNRGGDFDSQASQDSQPSSEPDVRQQQQQQQQEGGHDEGPLDATAIVAGPPLHPGADAADGACAGPASQQPAAGAAAAAGGAGQGIAGSAAAVGGPYGEALALQQQQQQVEEEADKQQQRLDEEQQRQQQEEDEAQQAQQQLDEQEEAFLRTITEDVQKLNDSYIEKEELNVIKLGTLEEKAVRAKKPEELQEAYKAFVDFHGELLLLLHWSILAYTGLVKILKKHHKRTGLLLRAPHLENLLSQPFCSVEVTCDMVRRAEAQVNALAAQLQVPPPDKVIVAAGAAAAAAAGMHVPAETVNSPFCHVGSASNLRAMAGKAAAAAAASPRAQPLAAVAVGGDGGSGGRGSGSGSGGVTGGVAPVAAAATAARRASTAAAAAATDALAAAEAGAAACAAPATAPAGAAAAPSQAAPPAVRGGSGLVGTKRGLEEAGVMEGSDMMRRTRAALNVWQQLQVTAATPSTVLPAGQAAPHPAQAAASGMTNSSVA